MFNCNGQLIHSLNEAPESILNSLHRSLSIREKVRLNHGKILFWETHYFRLIAALRRHRFQIPMNFTSDFLEGQIHKLIQLQSAEPARAGLFLFQFIPTNPIGFIVSFSISETLGLNDPKNIYTIDLFKEELITANGIANLSTTHCSLFHMAKNFAKENGLNDCILINEKKNLVEAISGTLYLYQKEDVLRTPSLISGCRDYAWRTAFNEWLQKHSSFSLIEEELSPFELQQADAVFILSSAHGLTFVSDYRKTHYNKGNEQLILEQFIAYINQL